MKYLINLKPDIDMSSSVSGWKTLNNPANELFMPEKINQFEDCVIAVIQFEDYARGQILAVAKELLSVAKEVKIVIIKEAAQITEELLNNAPAVSQSLLDMDDDDFETITDMGSFQSLHSTHDYKNGVIYYGTTIQGKDMIVPSDSEPFSFAAALQRKILLEPKELSVSHLRQVTVLDYTSGGLKCIPDSIFTTLSNYIKKHIYFPEAQTYDLIAVWIMGTYIFKAFRYYPYLHLNAEKGSGKTLLMELMSPVAFNGILLSQPAASTVLKLIEQSSPSLFIDEAEGLSQRKNGGNNQLIQFFKTGFARSGVYYIGDKRYPTYSPKCFAGINEFDNVLADRAITIKMMRKTVSDKVALYRETAGMLNQQMMMRDQLYLFGLTLGPIIGKDYEAIKPHYDQLNHITNRAYDVWVPLYRIVSAFENGKMQAQIFNSLDKLSQLDGQRRKMRDAEENETGALLIGLSEILDELKPYSEDDGIKYYVTDEIYDRMIEDEKIPKGLKKKGFSGLLKRVLEIYTEPKQYLDRTKRMYAIDTKTFGEYKKRYSDTIENAV